MHFRPAPVLSLLLLAFASPAFAADPPRVFPYPYEKHTLPNGLIAIFVPMPSPGVVAYYSIVRTGSRDEVEPGKSGFAHFCEHMMFRGTPKFPQAVYEGLVTKMGAAAFADALVADAPSPLTYASPKPAAIMETDKAIAAFPLKIERARIKIVPVAELFAQ